jgi:hypothetical protein
MTTTSRDKIEQHLIQQKARAVQPGELIDDQTADRCQYRTASGLMCAAGCLIPDEKYIPEMEGLTAHGVKNNFGDIFPQDISDRELNHWQDYHDNYSLIGHSYYSYKNWINGDETNHPSEFKKILAETLKPVEPSIVVCEP